MIWLLSGRLGGVGRGGGLDNMHIHMMEHNAETINNAYYILISIQLRSSEYRSS